MLKIQKTQRKQKEYCDKKAITKSEFIEGQKDLRMTLLHHCVNSALSLLAN